MAKTLISSPSFIGTPLPSLPRHHRTRLVATKVHLSLHQIPPVQSISHSVDFAGIFARAEGLFYTLADAAVASDPAVPTATTTDAAVQKSGGWFGFISEAMEFVLKVLKDGLSAIHVPYSYGFAIILLTVIVKAATLPLTKQQVESTLAMQNLQPKIKAIQERYAGNQAGVNPLAGCFPTLATIPVWIGLYQALSNVANEGLLTEGFFWIPSLGGPTTIAARQSGSGISWLFPFVDGHPPLGWQDTAAYLVLPILLIVSQYVSMEIMKPPQTDPSQKNSLLVLKFLPLMIGYFSLSVPSGLTIYWFTNNVLSTAQQVWLRKYGGAKPVVDVKCWWNYYCRPCYKNRFKQLKEEEKKKKLSKALPVEEVQSLVSASDDGSDVETDDKARVKWRRKERGDGQKGVRGYTAVLILVGPEAEEEAYASKVGKEVQNYSRERRSKRSKRKRAV
ncbi:hypothetical protein Fmac_022167 [Flemingia macrophylla]|uniref:Membrane insertase YidC/Oxa/ALB C-terminal domain-containing protein n=1 Tax=Flemingia macrophylla TaxID=520843 RepID=A0ABD1LYY6_9FABA